MTWIVAVAVICGLTAAMFARLCDGAMGLHAQLMKISPWATLLLLPIGFPLLAWLTLKFAPEAAGSGIPQVMAAAENRWSGRWGGKRVTLRTAAWKAVFTAGLLLCGGSTGREGPTVQVVAGILRTLTRGLKGGPGRRAIIIAGGAAGVSAAFNTPIAGVVFAVEELARGFDKRTNTTVILVVVAAGFAAYALQGDYAYFGQLQASTSVALGSAWFAAPIIGVSAGLLGGLFSRALVILIGPGDGKVTRWRRARPILFAFLCGLVAAVIAYASGGVTYGAGYEETKILITDHPDAVRLCFRQSRRQPRGLGMRRTRRHFRPLASDRGGDRRGLGQVWALGWGQRRGRTWNGELPFGRGASAAHQRGDPDGDDPRSWPRRPVDAGGAPGALGVGPGHARTDLPCARQELATDADDGAVSAPPLAAASPGGL